MAKIPNEPTHSTLESTIASPGEHPQQMQIEIDDSQTPTTYSSTVRVWGSPEEINLDFANHIRPTGTTSAKLKIDQRIVMNPWAAKRFCIALTQALAKYEQAYGPLEIDPRKRLANRPAQQSAATPGPIPPIKPGKLS